MNATQQLHDLGQSLWLDNITRALLSSGTLSRYIREFAVTGLTSNPTIFDNAIQSSDSYDDAIQRKASEGKSGEALFFELALEDLTQAADLFRPIHDATGGVDGWVSLEVSPLLADDTAGTIAAAAQLHARAQRPNLFIKIPGTAAGIPAIEETIFAGIPVNVTLLFSREHYLAAAKAYMRGIERRIAADIDPKVASVASIFVSRWDVAVMDVVSAQFRNGLGIGIAMRTYKGYRDLLASPRWRKLAASGAQPQRLLWASTGSKDPTVSDTVYIEALAAPDTINTMPEKTLLAFADHGKIKGVLPVDEGYAETVLAEYTREGVNDEVLAATLQREGVEAFAKSWSELMAGIASRSGHLTQGRPQPSPEAGDISTNKRRTTMEHTLPALPYAMDALAPHMSKETFEYHYGKHHQAYVTNLNNLIKGTPFESKSLEEIVKSAPAGGIYNNAAQVSNHTFFWNCMKVSGGGTATGALGAAINKKWDSFDEFKKAFQTSAVGNFGSGWTWLVKKADGSVDIVNMGAAGTPITTTDKPLLCIDVWEHAYYIDYRNARPKFVETFLNHLANWDFAAKNFS